jgi:hypothetical protein
MFQPHLGYGYRFGVGFGFGEGAAVLDEVQGQVVQVVPFLAGPGAPTEVP